ncbi:putative reverse transcriptase domain-containing protein [Tanacetum coccineum]
MLVDALLQHKVEGQVNRMVEKVRGLETKQEVVEVAKEMAEGNVRTMNNGRGGCSYKEFMACNPKDYDGKGGAIVYTRLIKKMESVQDMSGCGENQKEFCPNNEMQKLETEFWYHAMVGAGNAAYTDRFHELVRLVPHLVTPENKIIKRYIYGLAPQICAMVVATKPTTIQSVVLKAGMLTDEAIRNGALKKITKKRGNNGEPSRDGKARDDNTRSRTGRAFATITNPIRKEYTGTAPKCPNCNYHHQPEMPCRLCTNCNRLGHIAKDCRVGPRVVNPLNDRNPTDARGACFECGGTNHYKATCLRLNRVPRSGGNHPNQVMAIEGGQGRGNNGNQTRGRAFVMGAEEARQDSNIVMGTFTLNNHYSTTLFDSGADYSFVSTTFLPMLDIEPSNLVRIPLLNGEILRVLGERLEEKVRHLLSAKAKEQKLKDIIVVRNFSERTPRQGFHSTKFIAMGSTSIFVKKKDGSFRMCIDYKELNKLAIKNCYPLPKIDDLFDQLQGSRYFSKINLRNALCSDESTSSIQGLDEPRLILELLKKEKLYAKFSKCEFWLQEVQFLGHVINSDGIHVDPSKIKSVKNLEAPRTPSEVRSFLEYSRSACELVRADPVMKCRDAVTKWVVTASCRVGDAISNRCEHNLERCWCRSIVLSVSSTNEPKSRVFLPNAF